MADAPGARGKGAPDAGTNHLGFRRVMIAEPPPQTPRTGSQESN